MLAMVSCARPALAMAHGRQVTMPSCLCLPFLLAIASWRLVTSTFCLSSPLSSPWRVDLCNSSCFLASKVSRRAFSYKELALDVKSIIE